VNEPLRVGEVVQLVRGTGRWYASSEHRIGEGVLITGPLARRALDDKLLRYRVMCVWTDISSTSCPVRSQGIQ
jgi:hypothetical protein